MKRPFLGGIVVNRRALQTKIIEPFVSLRVRSQAGLALLFAAWVVLVSACTTGTAPVSQSPTAVVQPASTIAATSTRRSSMVENLTALLGDDTFSAEVQLESIHRQPGVDQVSHGSGAISGSDSTLRMEHDFSSITSIIIDNRGRLVGPGGLTSSTEESRRVGGNMYHADDGGLWQWQGEGGDTTLGHVFERLGQVQEFVDIGVVSLDGEELHRFQPATDPKFEPFYWQLEESVLETFAVQTDVYTDDTGVPRQVHLEIAFRHPAFGPVIWSQVYRVTRVGEPITIAKPDSWTSLSDLDYEGLADLLVPTAWKVWMHERGTIGLESTDGHRLAVNLTLYNTIDPETALRNWLDALELEAESVNESDLGVFPSAYASVSFETPTAAYAEVRALGIDVGGTSVPYVALGLVLSSPTDQELEEVFLDLIGTIRWRNPALLVGRPTPIPGETLADEVLQADTANLVLPVVSQDFDCEDPSVIHTDLVTGSADGWSEAWYVSCEVLLVLRVDYALVPGGGFSISVGPPELVDG